jgi:hypothetical protein
MKFNSFIFSALIVLHSVLLIDDSYSQWQPDVRLTNAPDSSITSVNYNPKAITVSGNNVFTVWGDKRAGNFDIFFKCSTDSGITWGNDIRLTLDVAIQKNPAIAASGSYVHVVWQDGRITGVDAEIFYKRSTNGGLTWSNDTRITYHTPNPPFLTLGAYPSITAQGTTVHIFWHDNRIYNQPQIFNKYSFDNGESWFDDNLISTIIQTNLFPACTISGPFVNVFWQHIQQMDGALYQRHSSDFGLTWKNDTLLSATDTSYFFCHSASSGQLVFVVWADNRFGNREIIFKRSADGGKTWGPDTRLTFDPEVSRNPSVAVSGSNVHVVWYDNRDYDNEIYYKRSTDGGITWSNDERLTNDNLDSNIPSVSVSGTTVHVLWQDWRDGDYEIYYKRNPTGNPVGIQNIISGIPEKFNLEQNYPNPFNPVTTLKFDIPNCHSCKCRNPEVLLIIYDLLGREIETLVNENLAPGSYSVKFNASKYPSGIYFYRLLSEKYFETKKMILIK